jgi:hypothetical protein
MPFSLYSYLLGVGTVIGALAFGFGGGVLLTNTAMKDTSSGQTRIERVARTEPPPAAAQQVASVPENTAPSAPQAPAAQPPANAVQPPAAAVQAPAAQPAAAPVAVTQPPKPEPQKEAERVKEPGPAQPAEQARQTEPKRDAQGKAAEREQDEQGKAAERKPERSRRYAERKYRDTSVARMKPRRLEVVDEPEEAVPAPQEQHFDLFKMPNLFGRPEDGNE